VSSSSLSNILKSLITDDTFTVFRVPALVLSSESALPEVKAFKAARVIAAA